MSIYLFPSIIPFFFSFLMNFTHIGCCKTLVGWTSETLLICGISILGAFPFLYFFPKLQTQFFAVALGGIILFMFIKYQDWRLLESMKKSYQEIRNKNNISRVKFEKTPEWLKKELEESMYASEFYQGKPQPKSTEEK